MTFEKEITNINLLFTIVSGRRNGGGDGRTSRAHRCASIRRHRFDTRWNDSQRIRPLVVFPPSFPHFFQIYLPYYPISTFPNHHRLVGKFRIYSTAVVHRRRGRRVNRTPVDHQILRSPWEWRHRCETPAEVSDFSSWIPNFRWVFGSLTWSECFPLLSLDSVPYIYPHAIPFRSLCVVFSVRQIYPQTNIKIKKYGK